MSAVKKKKVVDEPQSKTARASMKKGKTKDDGFKASGDMHRFISLNGGKNAYLLDPRDGKTLHLTIGSEQWAQVVGELLASEHSTRINDELIANGWEVSSAS